MMKRRAGSTTDSGILSAPSNAAQATMISGDEENSWRNGGWIPGLTLAQRASRARRRSSTGD
eukprot:6554013-Lingulodinium_polyedra.AAC.1